MEQQSLEQQTALGQQVTTDLGAVVVPVEGQQQAIRAAIRLESKVSNAFINLSPSPAKRWSNLNALSALTAQSALAEQATAIRSELAKQATNVRELGNKEQVKQDNRDPVMRAKARSIEAAQKAAAERRLQRAAARKSLMNKEREQQRVEQMNSLAEFQELGELNIKQNNKDPLDLGLDPFAATDSIDNSLQTKDGGRVQSLKNLAEILSKQSPVDSNYLRWGGSIKNASQRSFLQTAIEGSRGLAAVKKSGGVKHEAVLSNSKMGAKEKGTKLVAAVGIKALARTNSLANQGVAKRILDVATMQDMVNSRLRTSVDRTLEELSERYDLEEEVQSIKSINSAKEYQLSEMLSFRQGVTKANIRRKVDLYNAMSLISHMIAHWIITKEATKHIREELERGGISEVPQSLDGGDFFEELVKMFETANVVIEGKSIEEAIESVKNIVDARTYADRLKGIYEKFEEEFGGLVGFSFDS